MSQTINLAMIGCGHWGLRWIRIFESLGATVKVCCDIDERTLRRAGELASHAILTTNYKSILNSKNIEAVYIATPPSTHFKIAKDCLLAEKHVFVEKPLTTDYQHGLELARLAVERNRTLMVGNTYLYNKAVQKIKRLLKSGVIGKLKYIHLWMTNSLDMWIGKNMSNYSDVVWDLGSHPISIINYMIDEWPFEVIAFTRKPSLESDDVFDEVSANLYFPGEVTAMLYLNWLDYRRNRRILVLGEQGAVWCEDFSNKESITVYTRRFGLSEGLMKLEQIKSYKVDVRDTLENEAKHFLSCICTNSTPISDGLNGAVTVSVIETIYQSIAENKPSRVNKPLHDHGFNSDGS